jgi:hypothetical protein
MVHIGIECQKKQDPGPYNLKARASSGRNKAVLPSDATQPTQLFRMGFWSGVNRGSIQGGGLNMREGNFKGKRGISRAPSRKIICEMPGPARVVESKGQTEAISLCANLKRQMSPMVSQDFHRPYTRHQ